MIKNSFLLIALRYLTAKQKDATIKSMIKICFIGICIATMALALVISIMEGFEYTTYQKMQSIHPDLILDSHGKDININKLQPILQEPQYHITQFSVQKTGQILLHTQECSTPVVTCLKGVNPHHEQVVNNIHTKIIQPLNSNLSSTLTQNNIIIGSKLANTLNLTVGDFVKILYTTDEPENRHVKFQQATTTIGAIFKTGIDEFDSNLVYCSLSLFEKLFPDTGITQIHLKLNNKKYETNTIKQLQQRLHIDIYSWQDLYPALVSALKLEKYAMFFILLLIVLIASMNIISLIFMYITQKYKEIALLISFGMPLYKIKALFIIMSLIVSVSATTTGLFCAYILGKLLQTFPIITLPDEAYLTTHLPIQLDPLVFFVIFMSSLIISFIASIISTKKLHKIDIIQALKSE